MDRNTIIGMLLIGVVLIGMIWFNKPNEKQIDEYRRKQDSIAMVQQQVNSEKQQNNVLASNINLDSIVSDSTASSILTERFGDFAKTAVGTRDYVVLENNLIKLTLSNKGGRPYTVELKNFVTHDSLPLLLLNGDSTVFGIDFYAQNRPISTNDLYFTPVDAQKQILVSETDSAKSVTMRLAVNDSAYIDYVYTLPHNSYMLRFSIRTVGMSSYISKNTNTLDLKWSQYIPQQEKGRKNELQYTNVYYRFFQDDVDHLKSLSKGEERKEDISTRVQWVAFKQQFFSSVLIADNAFTNTQVKSFGLEDSNSSLATMAAQVSVPYQSDKDNAISMSMYFGPNDFKILKKYDKKLESLVNVGKNIIRWINQFVIIPIFAFLGSYIGNYGLIILLLTLIIKLFLFPLTYKSYLSQARMRVLKPQIDAINERIPADKALERQQATMALYKKAGVNPMGGCLPILLQLPILFAMFRFFPTSIELRQEAFLWANDLSTYDSIFSWSGEIPIVSWLFGNHISLFTILMTITTMISMWMSNATNTSQTLPGMKTMMYIMPVMFMFMLNDFSAGLTYYYTLANIITIGQNEVFRRVIDENKVLARINENKKKPVKKSAFQQRLEAAAKARGMKLPKK